MKGFKEAYKSIFHYYNEHGSHGNSFYISNMHWIHFIPNQSFMNILHGYKLVLLLYTCQISMSLPDSGRIRKIWKFIHYILHDRTIAIHTKIYFFRRICNILSSTFKNCDKIMKKFDIFNEVNDNNFKLRIKLSQYLVNEHYF